jgi:hypothetical protein
MIETPSSTSGANQSRLELAVAAAAAERANKPRWLIVLGAMLLVGTTIFALVAANTRLTATNKVSDEWARTQRVLELKLALQKEVANLAAKGMVNDGLTNAKIEKLARDNQLTLKDIVSDSPQTPMANLGLRQHQYNARAANQSPESILRWLIATQESPELPGLEINRLVFRPGTGTAENTPGWNVEVYFNRWEKFP